MPLCQTHLHIQLTSQEIKVYVYVAQKHKLLDVLRSCCTTHSVFDNELIQVHIHGSPEWPRCLVSAIAYPASQ